ncbi:hypothetical protein C9374_012928 [Naegleria lovaniensis]|uniref:Uncharacterized protein n=1 Tax=Naegleria lovaniensis TaxID=51637 RepID=A0AA88GCH1_NAELO|nr:uncharacterized protein C9374_012928 [Naegleria lovaniensis]KAG2372985.1 hypothetical protein C9374_012928 [Naegleria lovaniensis]
MSFDSNATIILKIYSLLTLICCIGAAIFHLIALGLYADRTKESTPTETYIALGFTSGACVLMAFFSFFHVLRLLISSLRSNYSKFNNVMWCLYVAISGFTMGCGTLESTMTGMLYRGQRSGNNVQIVDSLFASSIVVSGVALMAVMDGLMSRANQKSIC